MMRWAGCLITALLCVGCVSSASTNDASGVLRATADNMGRIHSGDLFVRLETGLKDEKPSGFELAGKFSLRSSGDLPVADLKHTSFDGTQESSGRFVSTGREAFVVRGDRTVQVPEAQLGDLRGLLGRKDSSLGRLAIGDWISGTPTIEGGGVVGGVDSNKITARLDVAKVINGLLELARSFGGGAAATLQPIPGSERARVARSVRVATVEVWSGKDDRTLRKLVLHVEFAVRRKSTADALGKFSGVTINLEASIAKLNESVRVETPK